MKIKQAVPIYPVVLRGIVLMHNFNGLYRQRVYKWHKTKWIVIDIYDNDVIPMTL